MTMRPLNLSLLALLAASTLPAQGGPVQHASATLPFEIGEELVYGVSAGRFGRIGSGTMRVDGPEEVRGHSTYLLRFDLESRVVGMRVEARTRSWLDPVRMRSLRFTKRERHPLSSSHHEIELHPEQGWWAADDDSGSLETDAPLDELSFIYFIRTLPLLAGDQYLLVRHFDQARNPTRIHVVGREQLTVPAGEYATVVVEMRVKDEGRYGGEGIIRLHLTDDDRRLPVRIESRMPVVGRMVLALESASARTVALRAPLGAPELP